ncbi:ABC transporter permease [Acrocarpospora corrugata]|uniref:Oligopeptide transport system permease protein OppC n=1 Tax=Acrocarpospora corrugata TaxID=35763 RepID=A0A5M3VXW8_9ACTN|nr:ABC transporter permease [Acrocarpospora corrugata]GER99660.1 ABC transporter permease [Acrocarpospora corrugata]
MPHGAEVTSTTGASHGPARLDREFTVKARSQGHLILRRFLRHKLAVASLFVFIAVVLFAFAGGAFWHYSYDQLTPDISAPPSLRHPFGTDSTGMDLMAMVMRGTQRSLEIALFVALTATGVGTVYGAIAGYYRGVFDTFMMRFVDLVLTFPTIAVAAILGAQVGASAGSWFFIGIILAALTWPIVARVVRGSVLSLREKEFIEAAHALGARDRRIIFGHLVPNVMGPVIVSVTILVAGAILSETGLSFIGFGVLPPDTSLGLLVSQAQTAVSTRPWLFYFPGAFIILIVLSINFIGDGLRDAFDPTTTRVRS